jgi:hypothetical protein
VVEILEFRPFQKNTLQGFLTVRTPSGWEIRDIAVHSKNGKQWLGMPSKKVSKEGEADVWLPIVKLADPERWKQFQVETLKALDAYKPVKEEKPENDVPF